jgi:hypothetical protein
MIFSFWQIILVLIIIIFIFSDVNILLKNLKNNITKLTKTINKK